MEFKNSLFPTFIGVGVARSGTTSLYHWLRQHPSVFMTPVKEPNYFSQLQPRFSGPGDDGLNLPVDRTPDGRFTDRHAAIFTTWNDYANLFLGSNGYDIRGEISPSYLYYPQAAHTIKNRLPESKIIILMRDPVERAYSHYKLFRMWRREAEDFETAISFEEERIRGGWEYAWAYKGLGMYCSQVKQYLELFPRAQIGIWLFEDMVSDPATFYKEICEFLGMNDQFIPDFKQHNISVVEVANLQRYYNRSSHLIKVLGIFVPSYLMRSIRLSLDTTFGKRSLTISLETRSFLLEYYREDILALHELLPNLKVIRWIQDQKMKLRDAK